MTMLAAPAAAQAATYTVKAGDGACGGADLACGTLADAATAAASGDVFDVAPGTYGSATFTVGGVTVAGSPTFTVDGTLTFSAATGGVSKLQKATIVRSTATPGVLVSGAAGLEVSDSTVLSAGDAVVFAEGTTNKLVRCVVATAGGTAAAVRVTSADLSTAAKQLTLESSLLTGGAAALSVNTGVSGIGSTAGAVTVNLRHVTAAGSTNGLVLDASKAANALGGPSGNITADVTDSIIQNGTAKTTYPGIPPILGVVISPPNTVTDTYTRTLQGAFDANAVFVDPARRRFRLKAGSPAINAGGVTPGESATDFEGQDRSTAPTDQGADEFVPAPAPPPPGPPTPPPPGSTNDGVAPAVVITKPKANQKIKLLTTKTTTVTRNGKRVRRKTSRRTKIGFSGTAADKSGVVGVVLTLERLTTTASAPAKKCRWFNPTKGIVLKSCTKPILVLAKLAANGTWSYNVKSTTRLGAGVYRLVVAGRDKSGKAGNSAPIKDAVHRFKLVK